MEKLEKENVEPIVEKQDTAVDSVENDTTSKVEDKKTPPTKKHLSYVRFDFSVKTLVIFFRDHSITQRINENIEDKKPTVTNEQLKIHNTQ